VKRDKNTKKEAFASFLLKKREVNTSVRPRFYMSWVACEIGIFTVLDNKPSVFF